MAREKISAMTFREKAASWEKRLERIENWVMILLTVLLVVVTFLQVFSRYALRNPFFWTEELARFLFIYVCMLGIAMGIASKGHYGFDAFFTSLPRKLKAPMGLMIYFIMGFFILVLTIQGFKELPSTTNQVSVSLPVTMVWSYVALPAGGILMLIHHLLRFIIEGPARWH
jgi:TRAP-type C4-dicarboxylate transport system permease small subunit